MCQESTALHHVTGDPELEQYLYAELLHDREFLHKADTAYAGNGKAFDYIYAGLMTNFDNPDMTGVALWLGLYLENDPEVTTVLRKFLETGWWNREGESHTAAKCKQPFWNAIYMTITDQGVAQELVEHTADLLKGFALGPYWNTARINCDAAETEAGECLAVDGKTVLKLDGVSGDDLMATEALHPSIRPPSNFDSRSNPFEVNGGGGPRLNPGGDLLAAYWISRYMQAGQPGEFNLSPNARDHMPVGGWPDNPEPQPEPSPDIVTQPDTSTADAVAPIDILPEIQPAVEPQPETGSSSGSCSTTHRTPSLPTFLLLAAFFACLATIRQRRTS